MKVSQLIEKLDLKILSNGEDKEIAGVYVGDLLSRVMSSTEEGNAWITVQAHLNVVAVAELNGISCVILPEKIEFDENSAQKATEKGIYILQSDLTAYELCWKLHEKILL